MERPHELESQHQQHDGGVLHVDRAVQVGEAVVIGAGQVAVAPGRVRTGGRDVIQRTAQRFGALYIIPVQQRSGRRHQRDPAPARETRRAHRLF